MTRARHVTPSATAERLERVRTLITALLVSDLSRDQIGSLLKVGPSGVRKYLADLGAKVKIIGALGAQVCRLAISVDEARAYLAVLAIQAQARPAPKPRATMLDLAARDQSRHIHIMLDDEDFKPRMFRGLPAHEPMMAHFFNLVPAQVWA
jgi:hypothetical protein